MKHEMSKSNEEPKEETKAISKQEFARLCGFSLQKLEYLIDANDVAVFHVGVKVMIGRRQLEKFLGRNHPTRPVKRSPKGNHGTGAAIPENAAPEPPERMYEDDPQ